MTFPKKLKFKTPAKINLGLHIHKKRDDGFHNLRTLFTYIDLYDYLSFRETEKKVELKEKNPIKVGFSKNLRPFF